jgi:hypothetical protein
MEKVAKSLLASVSHKKANRGEKPELVSSAQTETVAADAHCTPKKAIIEN